MSLGIHVEKLVSSCIIDEKWAILQGIMESSTPVWESLDKLENDVSSKLQMKIKEGKKKEFLNISGTTSEANEG